MMPTVTAEFAALPAAAARGIAAAERINPRRVIEFLSMGQLPR
jgi:hypothetical protein